MEEQIARLVRSTAGNGPKPGTAGLLDDRGLLEGCVGYDGLGKAGGGPGGQRGPGAETE